MDDKTTADSKPAEGPVWVRSILNPTPRPGTHPKKRGRAQGELTDTLDDKIEKCVQEEVEKRVLEMEKRIQDEVESMVEEEVETRTAELESRLQQVEEDRDRFESQVAQVMAYMDLDNKIEKRVEEAVERKVQEAERKIKEEMESRVHEEVETQTEELASRVRKVEEAWVRLEDQLAQVRAVMGSQQQPLVDAPKP